MLDRKTYRHFFLRAYLVTRLAFFGTNCQIVEGEICMRQGRVLSKLGQFDSGPKFPDLFFSQCHFRKG